MSKKVFEAPTMGRDDGQTAMVLKIHGESVAQWSGLGQLIQNARTRAAKAAVDEELTDVGKDAERGRAAAEARDGLKPFEAKLTDLKKVVAGLREEAVEEWRGELDPAESREIRDELRRRGTADDPVKLSVMISDALDRGDRKFIGALATAPDAFPMMKSKVFGDTSEWERAEAFVIEQSDLKSEIDAAETKVVQLTGLIGAAKADITKVEQA